MTKAKTRGEKLRARRGKMGRPCKVDVARTKSGRISYAVSGGEPPDILAKRKRVEMYGGDMKGAGDQMRGTLIGRLRLSNEISDVQHSALQRYFELSERYFASIHAPDSLRSKSGGSAMRIPDDEADVLTQKNWRDVMTVIGDAQKYHNGNLLAALHFMVVRDEFHEHMLGDVRLAANALARHYGIS